MDDYCKATVNLTPDESGLAITLEFPPEVTDDQIIDAVAAAALEADRLDRAFGGHGLQVDSVTIER